MHTDFIDEVIKRFTTHITDCMFLYLQSDRELMREYLEKTPGERDAINRQLGKAIKERFDLKNGDENTSPRSTLIDSYTQHLE